MKRNGDSGIQDNICALIQRMRKGCTMRRKWRGFDQTLEKIKLQKPQTDPKRPQTPPNAIWLRPKAG